jgi:hypothetical protein
VTLLFAEEHLKKQKSDSSGSYVSEASTAVMDEGGVDVEGSPLEQVLHEPQSEEKQDKEDTKEEPDQPRTEEQQEISHEEVRKQPVDNADETKQEEGRQSNVVFDEGNPDTEPNGMTITVESSGMKIHPDGRVTFDKYSDESSSQDSGQLTSQSETNSEEQTETDQQQTKAHIVRNTPPDSPTDSPLAEALKLNPITASTPTERQESPVSAYLHEKGNLEGDSMMSVTIFNESNVTLTPRDLAGALGQRAKLAMSPGLLKEEMRRLQEMSAEGEDNIELQAKKLG